VKRRGAAHISDIPTQEPICIGHTRKPIDHHSGWGFRLESYPEES
jgi:hypothetical protein